MVNVANATVDTFIECMRANRCGVHGPLAGGEAAAAAVRLAIDHTAEYAAEYAGRADVAIPVGDPLVLELEIERLLDEGGASVLRSDAADWDTRLRTAAVGITGSLKQILFGPATVDDGSQNLVGAIMTSMGNVGARSIRAFQETELIIAPSIRTEGKLFQAVQSVGMGTQ